jgi:hypothetical protein
MEHLKDPGVLLASLDLLGLAAGFVYIQRQIDDLKSKIGEDSAASESLKNIQINADVFDQTFKSFAERLKLHEMVLTSFGERIAQIEKKISETSEIKEPIKTLPLATDKQETSNPARSLASGRSNSQVVKKGDNEENNKNRHSRAGREKTPPRKEREKSPLQKEKDNEENTKNRHSRVGREKTPPRKEREKSPSEREKEAKSPVQKEKSPSKKEREKSPPKKVKEEEKSSSPSELSDEEGEESEVIETDEDFITSLARKKAEQVKKGKNPTT